MQFGISLIMRGEEATPQTFTDMAQLAEQTGLHALWCSSHFVIPQQTESRYGMSADGKLPLTWRQRYFDPWTTLSYLAARTTTLRLGTSVLILPMHNPLEVAALAADLDQFSGGRFNLGVGVGWFSEEFDLLGWPFRQRGARCNDGLALLRTLWSGGRSFQGRFHQFEDLDFGPLPVQQPHPPIYVGGASEAALKRTAIYGDVWHPIKVPLNDLPAQRARLQQLREEAGRGDEPLRVALKAPLKVLPGTPGDSPFGTVGAARDIADTLLRYRDAGVDEWCFDFIPETRAMAMETLQRFADEVRPLLD